MNRKLRQRSMHVVLALALILAPGAIFAACLDYGEGPSYIREEINGDFFATATVGEMIYAVGDHIFSVIDATNSPVELGSIALPEKALDIAVQGDYAYVAGDMGLHVVDISDSSTPTLVGNGASWLDGDAFEANIEVSGEHVWVNTLSGIYHVNVANPEYVSQMSRYEEISSYDYSTGIVIEAGQVYALTMEPGTPGNLSNKLIIFDLDPTVGPTYIMPVSEIDLESLVPCVDASTWIRGLEGGDGHLYMGVHYMGETAIAVLSLLDPLNPINLGCTPYDGYYDTLDLAGRYLYVGPVEDNGEYGLGVFNVENPAAMTYIGATFPTEGDQTAGMSVSLTSNHVVLARGYGRSFDDVELIPRHCDAPVINPRSVTFGIAPQSPQNMNVIWRFTWVTDYWSDPLLDRVTIANGAYTPVECQLTQFTKVATDSDVYANCKPYPGGGWQHTFSFNGGLCIPSCSWQSTVTSSRTGIDTDAGKRIKITHCPSTGFDMLIVEDSQSELPIRLLAPQPNPFNPSTKLRFYLNESVGEVRLSIFDVSGRQIRSFDITNTGEGWQELTWQGRDHNGDTVASGAYLARLTVDGRPAGETQRLLMLK